MTTTTITMSRRNCSMGFTALVLTACLATPCLAQNDDEDYGTAYARVRYVEGQASLQRTGEGEIVEATLNSPVVPGDRLWTDAGRAEAALADGTILRLDELTRLTLRTLADRDNRYESSNLLALESGAIRIDMPEPESRDVVFQIDTEGGSIYLLSAGSFRIDSEGGMTTVSSYGGVAEVSGDAGSVLVRSGERTSVRQGRVPGDPRPFNTLRQDDFDRFVEERAAAYLRQGDDTPIEQIEEGVPEAVHPYVPELSIYGHWHNVPTYGWVWRPAYFGSWGPYVQGYWSLTPVGWVWVSYDPWGWAPYHYGRWDFVGDLGWIWIPGARWSGAWVSFAVSTSYIGWCPLNYYNYPVFHDAAFVNVVNINVTRVNPRGWRFVEVNQFAGPRGARGQILNADRLPRGTDLVVTGRLPRFDPGEFREHPERGSGLVDRVRQHRTPLPAPVGARPQPFRDVERAAPRGGRETAPRGQAATTDRLRRQPPHGRPDGPARAAPGTSGRPRGTSPRLQQAGPRTSGAPPARPRVTPAPRKEQPAPPRSRARTVEPGGTPSGAPADGKSKERAGSSGSRGNHAVERLFEGARGGSKKQRVAPPGDQKAPRDRDKADTKRERPRTESARPRESPRQAPPRGEAKKPEQPRDRGESHNDKPKDRGNRG